MPKKMRCMADGCKNSFPKSENVHDGYCEECYLYIPSDGCRNRDHGGGGYYEDEENVKTKNQNHSYYCSCKDCEHDRYNTNPKSGGYYKKEYYEDAKRKTQNHNSHCLCADCEYDREEENAKRKKQKNKRQSISTSSH